MSTPDDSGPRRPGRFALSADARGEDDAARRSITSEVRIYLDRHRGTLAEQVDEGGGLALGRRHAKVMDGLLRALFAAATVRSGAQKPVLLAAVGSYGRGAVALGSDLDLRFLCASPDEGARVAEAMLYPLWDARASVGHQVVTIPELLALAQNDLPTATALLDFRPLAGDEALARTLFAKARGGVLGDRGASVLIEKLADEVATRHERFGGSVYLLEPDVKNGPGGLRDVDVLGWACRARLGVASPAELVQAGVLSTREGEGLAEATELLWRIRNRLHRAAGRRSDRLSFDRQEELAVALGYGDDAAAVEALMGDYYRNARAIARAREVVFHRAEPPRKTRHKPRRVEGSFETDGERLAFVDGANVEADPELALALYEAAVRRGEAVHPAARDAIARATETPAFGSALRSSRPAAARFVRLVEHAGDVRFARGSILGELHDVGLLTAMIPEFSPVVGRVHHDVYHVYTVDIHSIAAVDRLRALARGEALGSELACRLAAEASRKTVLFVATLLHDIGKDTGGAAHAIRGAELAVAITARLGLDAESSAQVAALVRSHLALYHLATRRDVDDPATLDELLREVSDREGLRELYLLTVADVSTTSPTAMTAWKASMLEDLYLAADRALAGAPREVDERRIATKREAAIALAGAGSIEARLVATLPERLLVSHDPPALAEHARIAARSLAEGPLVTGGESHIAGMGELVVAAEDRPGLLASIAAVIAANRLTVQAAQIHSHLGPSGERRALDLFTVRGPGLAPNERARTTAKLQTELRAVLAGGPAPTVARETAFARPTPKVPSEVTIDDRASPTHTILEVMTRDRPGVLHALARVLAEAGLSIAIAKINTEGTRVADVFYVTTTAGQKLDPSPASVSALRSRILAALEQNPV